MSVILRERLVDDHKQFERLFAEIERQCIAKAADRPVDMPVLRAIVGYFGDGALLFHHALEDAIYMKLLKNQPKFREIYDLPEDHKLSWSAFARFALAVAGTCEDLVQTARSFIGNERVHFICEEEIFLPYAATHLDAEDWQSLERSVPASELLAADLNDPAVAKLLQAV